MRLVSPTRKQLAGIAGNAQLVLDTMVIPDGFEMLGLDLSFEITPTGSAGTGTSRTSALVKSIQIFNEQNEPVFNAETGLAMALAAAASALKYNDSDAVPSTSPAAFDQDGVLAGNALVESLYRIIANLKGKAYRIVVNLFLPTLAGYTTQPTSYTAGVNAVLLCLPLARAIEGECKMACMEIDANTRFDFSDQSIGSEYHDAVIISTSQLDTNLNGLSHSDNAYNAEQIADLVRSTILNADQGTGVGASGLTIFALQTQAARAGLVKASSSSAITIIAVAKYYVPSA
jgi:hypothetical protein